MRWTQKERQFSLSKQGHRFRKELTDPFLLGFKLTTQLKDIRHKYAKCIVLGLTDGSSCFCSR